MFSNSCSIPKAAKSFNGNTYTCTSIHIYVFNVIHFILIFCTWSHTHLQCFNTEHLLDDDDNDDGISFCISNNLQTKTSTWIFFFFKFDSSVGYFRRCRFCAHETRSTHLSYYVKFWNGMGIMSFFDFFFVCLFCLTVISCVWHLTCARELHSNAVLCLGCGVLIAWK